MKLSTLEYFIAVAEAGSITAAAQKLHVAQPSLTKSLQSLEQEIGVQLLYRSSSGVRVTEAGQRVLLDAKQITELCHSWKELASLNTLQQVNIYSHISLAGFLFPDIILRFREKHPEITISNCSDSHPERFISASAHKPALVLDICSQNSDIQSTLRSLGNHRQILAKGAYGVLVNSDSTLAKKPAVTFSDLVEHYLVLPNYILKESYEERMSATLIEDFLPKLIGVISPKRIIEVGAVSSVIDLVHQCPETYAISFAPAHYRYTGVQKGELTHVALAECGVEGELSLIYSLQAFRTYPVFQELIEDITEAFRQFLADMPSD